MERTDSYESRGSLIRDFRFGGSDRRFSFSRQTSFLQSHEPYSIDFNDSTRPFLSRTSSSVDIPQVPYWSGKDDKFLGKRKGPAENFSLSSFTLSEFRTIRSGLRYMKRLFFMISLNIAYSTAELFIGLLTGSVVFVIATSRNKGDQNLWGRFMF